MHTVLEAMPCQVADGFGLYRAFSNRGNAFDSRPIRFAFQHYTERMLCSSAVLTLQIWQAETPKTVVC